MIENTNTKQFYPGPILNNTLEITDFLFNDAEQIKIKHSKLNEEGILIDVDLNYPTDYEVIKVLPSDINAAEAALTASTGQITLKNVNVLAGEKLTVYRVSQIIQDKDYPRTGAFPAATHEGALDYLTMQNQEQKDEIDRALKVPISTQNFEGSLPLPIPSRALKINNDGTGFEMSEFDPDLALVITEEFKNQAQQAAANALSSQTAAANSATVATKQSQNATTQAANAKASADNAAALNQQLTTNFNKYNSDLQTDFNTYRNNLTNLKNESADELTNISDALRQTQASGYIKSIEPLVKVYADPNTSGLILKAGSIVYVSTNGTFKEVVIPADVTAGSTGLYTADGTRPLLCCYIPSSKTLVNLPLYQTYSQDTAPSADKLLNQKYGGWFDTSTNTVKYSYDGGATWTICSLPFAMGTPSTPSEGGTGWVNNIKNIFNGFGVIGQHCFMTRGVTIVLPNSRYEDGTLKNIERTSTALNLSSNIGLVSKICFTNGVHLMSYGSTYYFEQNNIPDMSRALSSSAVWFNTHENVIYRTIDKGVTWERVDTRCFVGILEKLTSQGQFTRLRVNNIAAFAKQETVNHVNARVDNLCNKSNSPDFANRITSLGLPANPVTTTTATYTCPDNGYIILMASRPTSKYTLNIYLNDIHIISASATAASFLNTYFRVNKGDKLKATTDFTSANWTITAQMFIPMQDLTVKEY